MKNYKSINLKFEVNIAVNLDPQTTETISSSIIHSSSRDKRVGVGKYSSFQLI